MYVCMYVCIHTHTYTYIVVPPKALAFYLTVISLVTLAIRAPAKGGLTELASKTYLFCALEISGTN